MPAAAREPPLPVAGDSADDPMLLSSSESQPSDSKTRTVESDSSGDEEPPKNSSGSRAPGMAGQCTYHGSGCSRVRELGHDGAPPRQIGGHKAAACTARRGSLVVLGSEIRAAQGCTIQDVELQGTTEWDQQLASGLPGRPSIPQALTTLLCSVSPSGVHLKVLRYFSSITAGGPQGFTEAHVRLLAGQCIKQFPHQSSRKVVCKTVSRSSPSTLAYSLSI